MTQRENHRLQARVDAELAQDAGGTMPDGGGGNAAISLGVGINKKAAGLNLSVGGAVSDGGSGGTERHQRGRVE